MKPFVCATYDLEGDGLLAPTAYQHISKLQSTCTTACEHYHISSGHFSMSHGVDFVWYPGSHCVCGRHPNLRKFQARECGKAADSALSVVGSRSKVEEGEMCVFGNGS